MTFNLKIKNVYRTFYVTSRSYCDNKSIYQRDEEGYKAPLVHGKPYPQWRKQWINREGEFRSKLSVFITKNPSPNILSFMQSIPDLTIDDVKNWWAKMKGIQEIENQKFLPERLATLGANLAAVHFFLYRGCAIRLKDKPTWMLGDITTLKLPGNYVEGYYIEAVDCSNFHHNGIRFEGLENLRGLSFLKWLSVKNNKHIDTWCIDRIAGQNGVSLEYFDMSGCQLTTGCIIALARMPKLKFLVITDPGDDIELQAALSSLEEYNPNLLIKTI